VAAGAGTTTVFERHHLRRRRARLGPVPRGVPFTPGNRRLRIDRVCFHCLCAGSSRSRSSKGHRWCPLPRGAASDCRPRARMGLGRLPRPASRGSAADLGGPGPIVEGVVQCDHGALAPAEGWSRASANIEGERRRFGRIDRRRRPESVTRRASTGRGCVLRREMATRRTHASRDSPSTAPSFQWRNALHERVLCDLPSDLPNRPPRGRRCGRSPRTRAETVRRTRSRPSRALPDAAPPRSSLTSLTVPSTPWGLTRDGRFLRHLHRGGSPCSPFTRLQRERRIRPAGVRSCERPRRP